MVIWGKNQYYLAFISNNVDADQWTVFVCELIVIVKAKYKEFSQLNLLARMRAGWLVGIFRICLQYVSIDRCAFIVMRGIRSIRFYLVSNTHVFRTFNGSVIFGSNLEVFSLVAMMSSDNTRAVRVMCPRGE